MSRLILMLVFAGCYNCAKTQDVQLWPGSHCFAGFMTEASASTFSHFILLPDGTLRTFAPGDEPKTFPGLDNVIAISAGTFHILALKKDGTVWAWGRNDEKELGNEALAPKNTNSATPVQVTGIKNAIAVSAFGKNSYALMRDGTVWAWGNATRGMTGDNGKLTSSLMNDARGLPVKVYGITNAIAIAGPMALLSDGTVVTWGEGYWGELGNGSNDPSVIPVKVKGLNNVAAIAWREHGALALLKDGTVWAGGENPKGQLGRKPVNDPDQSNVPVQVMELKNIVAIDANTVCLALLKDETVKAWGYGAIGGMGQGRPGTNDVNAVPLPVPGIAHAVAIKAGKDYGMALLSDGTLMGWGVNMLKEGVYHQSWNAVKIATINMK